jgi:hypothetical protein
VNTEPALIIGLIASIIVGVAQQVSDSGLVSNAGAVSVLGLVITIVPLIASAIIRNFVTPLGSPAPVPPAAPAPKP